jgi:ABC-2 type transport system ATP-binding protein
VAKSVIEVCGLSFQYGSQKILEDLNFNINAGEIIGLLGPNGAGKSTCLRLLSGFMSATSGTITFNNTALTPQATALRHQIGYVPEQAPLHEMLTVQEHLQLTQDSYTLKTETIVHMLDMFDLRAVQHHPVQYLSKGYRRRVALAMAFAANPALLLLDEPSDGLDPNQKRELGLSLKQAATKAAILLSTHQLHDVEVFCTRVLLLHKGRICFDGTPTALRNSAADKSLDTAFAKLTAATA